MIDLHVHSTFSDGSLTPEQLVDNALDIGLTALGLTDHDCTGGIDRFMAACALKGLNGIPGVEISADVKHGTLHVLGYFIDHRNRAFESVLENIRSGREARNRKILTKLNELGFKLTWDEVASYAGEDVIGRPHFAQAMVAKGYVAGTKKAFDLYLGKGKPGYVDRFRLLPADSMEIILKAGGVPVLAHPFTLDLDSKMLDEYVKELVDAGLQGIEGYYSEYTPQQQKEYQELAMKYHLVLTGGSDFHGGINPDVKLGSGFGSLRAPDELAERLRERAGSSLRSGGCRTTACQG